MYSPMNTPPGAGYPPQFIAHFPPVTPGPGPIIAIPAGALPAPPTEAEDATKPSDTELLHKIISAVAKLTHQVKTNGKAVREIAAQQCTIQDRLSLLEQNVARVDERAVEILDQGAEINENARKTVAELGGSRDDILDIRTLTNGCKDDVRDVKMLAGGSKDDIQEIKALSRSNKDDIQEIKAFSRTSKEGVQDIKASTSAISGRTDLDKIVGERVDAGTERCMAEISTLAGQVKELKQLIEDAAVKVDKMTNSS